MLLKLFVNIFRHFSGQGVAQENGLQSIWQVLQEEFAKQRLHHSRE